MPTNNTVLVGATAVFKATPEPAGSAIPAGVVPAWTSSDVTVLAPVIPNPDSTGIEGSFTGGAPGTATVTCSVTNPANGNVATGSVVVTVEAPPPPFPSSLSISQVS